MSIYILSPHDRVEKLVVRNIAKNEIKTVLDCTAWTVAATTKFGTELAQIMVDSDMNYEEPHNRSVSGFLEKILSTPWDVRGDALTLTGDDMLQ